LPLRAGSSIPFLCIPIAWPPIGLPRCILVVLHIFLDALSHTPFRKSPFPQLIIPCASPMTLRWTHVLLCQFPFWVLFLRDKQIPVGFRPLDICDLCVRWFSSGHHQAGLQATNPLRRKPLTTHNPPWCSNFEGHMSPVIDYTTPISTQSPHKVHTNLS
jgi:hypothetical protein